MAINYLGLAAGVLITGYGVYSHRQGSIGNRPNNLRQRQYAKLMIAAGIGLIGVGLYNSFYSSERNLRLSQNLNNIEEELKNSLHPYVKEFEKQAGARGIAQASGPIEEFPAHLSRFPHPGYVATKEGSLCVIPKTLPPLEKCDELSRKVLSEVARSPQILETMKDPGAIVKYFLMTKDWWDRQKVLAP